MKRHVLVNLLHKFHQTQTSFQTFDNACKVLKINRKINEKLVEENDSTCEKWLLK